MQSRRHPRAAQQAPPLATNRSPKKVLAPGLPKRDGSWDVKRPENARIWIRQYGGRILDFGAGRDKSSQALRSIGVVVDLFEPFVVEGRRMELLPQREWAIPGVERFLEAVRSRQWTSIFLNGVLQAIPFDADRQKVITILAALAGPGTTVYSESVAPRKTMLEIMKQSTGFLGVQELDDSGVKTTVKTYTYKTQSCLTDRDFARLFVAGFEDVKIKDSGGLIDVIARNPRPVDPDALRDALEFEFDLPYPNGERMGLVPDALEAFGERHGIDLNGGL